MCSNYDVEKSICFVLRLADKLFPRRIDIFHDTFGVQVRDLRALYLSRMKANLPSAVITIVLSALPFIFKFCKFFF